MLQNFIIALFILVQISFQITLSAQYQGWIRGNSFFSRSISQSAVGYDEMRNRVILMGGTGNLAFQLVSFKNGLFFDHGAKFFPGWIGGKGQYYTQINDIFYIIKYNGEKIESYNLKLDSLSVGDTHSIPQKVSSYGCLTSIIINKHSYLFVVGGYDGTAYYLNNFQAFNISANTWFNNPPSLQTKRRGLTCNVNNGKLYAIGGETEGEVPLNSIERLNVTNWLQGNSQYWQYVDTLTLSLSGVRSVVYGNDIIIIGGISGSHGEKVVHILNTNSDTVTTSESLTSWMYNAGSIIVNDILYVFDDAYWEYLELGNVSFKYDTYSPTSSPTKSPTQFPTNNPTQPSSAPTIDPTMTPTMDPPNDPTSDPTNDPTIDPTTDPTIDPTIYPTTDPTNDPTFNPTIDPTTDPTTDPTNDPTKNPTISPTLAPQSDDELMRSQFNDDTILSFEDIIFYIILICTPIILTLCGCLVKCKKIPKQITSKILLTDQTNYIGIILF
eukprot:15887_1